MRARGGYSQALPCIEFFSSVHCIFVRVHRVACKSACTGLLLQTRRSGVICLCVSVSVHVGHNRAAVQKRLSRSRCRLGADSWAQEPCIRWGFGPTNNKGYFRGQLPDTPQEIDAFSRYHYCSNLFLITLRLICNAYTWRRAVCAVAWSLCLSVCPSQASVLSKWPNSWIKPVFGRGATLGLSYALLQGIRFSPKLIGRRFAILFQHLT